jgi:hypothetical protein
MLRSRKAVAVACCVTLVVLGAIGVAQAAKPRGKIVADRGRKARAEAQRLAHAISQERYAPSAAFAARPPYGRVAGISTKRLAGFPLSGKSFLILGNGNVLLADNRDLADDTGRNAGGPTIRGARDVTIFRINLRVPKKANCLSIRFRFLTEEFPEFVGQEFNDGFIAELDDTTWDTNTTGSPKISAPRNFAFDTKGHLISVNGAGDATVSAARAKGTTYDGATRRLRASIRITPGKHKLYLSIFDQGDRQYDSAVFLDRLTLSRRAQCQSGAVRG